MEDIKIFFIRLNLFIIESLLAILLCIFLPLIFILRKKCKLIWGSTPLINYKYWSDAMREGGYQSVTLMNGWFNIHEKKDFDLYYHDFCPFIFPQKLKSCLGPFLGIIYVLLHGTVVHGTFRGIMIQHRSFFYRMERILYNLFNIKIIIIPYGSDSHIYSRITDMTMKNGLMISYPNAAKFENFTLGKISYWTKYADCIIAGSQIPLPRWDCLTPQPICIDLNTWSNKSDYSSANGVKGVVKIIHTPNHRGAKGTEFIIKAVSELKAEGFLIDLILLEGVPNNHVKQRLKDSDILIEQLITPWYAMSAIEGMATGLPVISDISNEDYTKVFRRYSFLNECPILTSSIESIKKDIQNLVTDPILRKNLGQAGRMYVKKYHSFKTAQYMFNSIYDKVLHNKDVDLINLFHPILGEYPNRSPKIKHPLVNNRIVDKSR